MTDQQKRAYDFITGRLDATGVSPTYDEIMRHLGLASKGGVFRLVQALIAQELLVKKPGRNQSLARAGVDLSHVSTEALVAELGKRGLFRG